MYGWGGGPGQKYAGEGGDAERICRVGWGGGGGLQKKYTGKKMNVGSQIMEKPLLYVSNRAITFEIPAGALKYVRMANVQSSSL